MKKIYKKIENWIWIILLVCALVYFHWLVGNLHIENETFKASQKQFDSEIEEKYARNKQLQTEIQAQFNDITKNLLEFLQKKPPAQNK